MLTSRRTNAAQALKIRALETQISNLLTENLSVRDTAIHLQSQLDESKSRHVVENFRAIQRQLEERLRECTDIVAGLGHVDKNQRRRSSLQPTKQSPPPREWRTRATLSEVLEQQPGHLPTIAEDKLYPRRTLEYVMFYRQWKALLTQYQRSSEVRAIIENASSESPEAGPPPTLHLNNIITEFSSLEKQDEAHASSTPIEGSGLLSVNFESRKRRRETYVRPDEDLQPSTNTSVAISEMPFLRSPERLQGKPIRANRRRRLSAQQEIHSDRVEVQDFEFTRKDAQEVQIKAEEEGQAIAAQRKDNIVDNRPDLQMRHHKQPSMSPQRSALGAKTTNLSPAKSTRYAAEEAAKEPVKSNLARLPIARKDLKEAPVVIQANTTTSEPDVAEIDLNNIKVEPKTPAFADLISPSSTQPSNLRGQSRDTPPPGDLSRSHSTSDSGPGGARPSRRARSAVNYAEPSLVRKMRRPTKDLADAVVLDKKSSAEPEEGQQPQRVVTIKKEQEWRPASSITTQELSRPEPGSPTRSRVVVQQQALGRPSSKNAIEEAEIQVYEEPAPTISEPHPQQELTQAMEALDIYEFKTSSPADLESSSILKPAKPASTLAAARRRQSMAPTASNANIKNPIPPIGSSRTRTMEAARSATGALQRATSTANSDRAARLSNVDKGLTARSRRKSMLT